MRKTSLRQVFVLAARDTLLLMFSVAKWHVFLDHLNGLTYERLGIRPLLIGKLNDPKNRSPMTPYR